MGDLKRTTNMPIFHNIPIGFGNIASIVVSQEEYNYQNGNPTEDVGFQDCLPWEELTKMSTDCPFKCLPVIAQMFYNDATGVPRCNSGGDHFCMFLNIWKVKFG